MNEVRAFALASMCLEVLGMEGFRVEQISSLERVTDVIRRIGKTYLTPFLDPSFNDFTDNNHFWLILWRDDEPVLVGGARMDDLAREPITGFWARTTRRGYSPGGADAVAEFSELCDRNIKGRVVYFGDMFGASAVRGKSDVLRCFLSLAHLSAITKWKPDAIYAFMREADMDRGADRVYGFLNAIPHPQVWNVDAPHRDTWEWCVFNRKEELEIAIEALTKRATRDHL